MLATLKIKDLAIIDEIEVDFEKGLNVITGETGAGKTILLNSILLLIGKKFNSKELIRFGKEKAVVEAIFYTDDEELIVKRSISRDGRSKCDINGALATINSLKENIGKFVEFAGQNQNQLLFKKENQLKLLDTFGGLEYELLQYENCYKEYMELNNKLNKFEKEKNEINEKINFYKYQLEQLDGANLDDINEEDELLKNIELSENLEQIKLTLKSGYFELTEKDNSILKKIISIKNNFSEISEIKENFNEISNILSDVEISLEEVGKNILNELALVSDRHFSIDSLYERLNIIKKLKKRFGKESIEELINYRDEIKENILKIEEKTFDIETMKNNKLKIEKELNIFAEKLYNRRVEIKSIFEKEVKKHLAQLKMEKVDFKVDINKLDNFTFLGNDEVEFLISTNRGEPFKPLYKVVSGGELSRIMLAFKTILSDFLEIPVLIFDEVDSGTGGETAYAIGKKLKEISSEHQVFVITHLPQVAAFADTHYKIEKLNKENRVVSKIKKLSENELITEIARMISGEKITQKAIENAKEMIKECK